MLEALKILEHAVLDSAAGGCSTDVRGSIDSLAGTEKL